MNGKRNTFVVAMCLLILGSGVSAQDTTPQLPTTVVEEAAPALYRNQANVAQSKMLHDRELAQAARDARIEKELKAAMAAQGMSARPPVITTAADFLEANKPPPAPPSDRPVPRRGNDYVPPFLIPEDPTASSNSSAGPESGPSAENEMIQSNPSSLELPKQKGGFFSKLFGKKKADSPPESAAPAMPSEYPTGPQVDMSPPETDAPVSEPFEIPDAPAMNEAPVAPPQPPAPAPQASNSATSGGSIFKGNKAAASSGGTKLTVVSDVNATVSGVLVKLFKGDQVEMLGQTGAIARIRLKDQRVGTVAASALR